MGGFGLGFGPRAQRRRRPRPIATGLPTIRPSGQWTGVPGSGFSAVPVDPVRTTAKPAMRLLVPPNQFYIGDGLLVAVIAGASNNGSLLDNMGLEKVVVHFEGNKVNILQPGYQQITDANGQVRSYFGWWAKLRHDGRNGHGNVYFEAIPRDASMQRRVMGPYQFSPQATFHDRAVTVEPSQTVIAGSRYQTITAALAYLASVSADNPLVTIKEAGTYTLGTAAAGYTGKGYCKIVADVPITIAKAGYTTDADAYYRTQYDGLRFSGSNITFDARFVSGIYQENTGGRQHWIDGARIINSGGRNALWREGLRPLGNFVRGNPWFTECQISGLPNPCVGASLVRGCTISQGYHDVVTDSACVVETRTDDWDPSYWASDAPAMTITYTGAELTATIELSGANDAASRTLTARWGANSANYTFGSTEAMRSAGTYLPSHVAAWLNGLGAGFTATVLDNTRRAAALSTAGNRGTAFTAQNVKSTVLTLVTTFDVHSDWFQQNNAAMPENCILANNCASGLVGQDIFIAGTSGAKDFLVLNNAFDHLLLTGTYTNHLNIASQITNANSHVVIAHNSWSGQSFALRGDMSYVPDSYCVLANNAVRDIVWPGTTSAALKLRNNHLLAGATGAALGTGTTTGGYQGQWFRDSATGKFDPRGAVRTSVRVPLVAVDRTGKARQASDAPGSEAVSAVPVVAVTGSGLGSLQFPPFNRQFANHAGHVGYPVANIASAGSPLLKFDSQGAFFIMVQVPHERTKVNREARIIGNANPGSAQAFSLVHYGDEHFDTPRHDEFRWRCLGTTGDQIDLSVDVQTNADAWQLVVVTVNGSGSYSIASYAAGKAKIAGTTQTSANAKLDTVSGTHVLLGDAASAPGTFTALAAPAGAWGGAVAFHGFVTGTFGNDAKWQAIAEGADIATTLTGATAFKLLRDYRRSASPTTALGSYVASDTTSAGTIYGTVSAGGNHFQAPAKYLHVKRLPDGYVICPPDGAARGSVAMTAVSAGLGGALFARVVSPAGTVLVPPFEVDGVGPAMAFTLSLPPFAGWGYLEFWAESDPSIVSRLTGRIGCGHKLSLVGQSQADIMLYSAGLTLAPSGRASFCGYIGVRSDPADTTTSPVPRFSASARPQLFVIEPVMTNAWNGVTAIAQRIEQHIAGEAICIVDTAIAGTNARDWIKDSSAGRKWALDVEVAKVGGTDRVPIWQWYTSDAGYYPGVLDAVVLGTGTLAADHTLFDGSINAAGYKLGISLPTRATSTLAGPFDGDNFSTLRSTAELAQLAWVQARPALAVAGPPTTDLAIDNLAAGTAVGPDANLGGPHESQVLAEGVWRLGYRIGETYLRARGLSPVPGNPSLNPAQVTINLTRTAITCKAVLPNGGALKTQANHVVEGFELSTDGGTTWTRAGFTAAITAADTVVLTKTAGAWPAGVKVTYLRGGPFSYGTAEELAGHYKGSLYDGCSAESGLGFPLLGIPQESAVTV